MTSLVRKAVWLRAKGKCEVCGKKVNRQNWEAHVHHKLYRGRDKELPEDLELRCLACHTERHPQHEFLTRGEQRKRSSKQAYRMDRPTAGLTKYEKRDFAYGRSWAWRPPSGIKGLVSL